MICFYLIIIIVVSTQNFVLKNDNKMQVQSLKIIILAIKTAYIILFDIKQFIIIQ